MLETYRASFADFLQKPALCRRAGCTEAKLGLVASKELIDNALDASPDYVDVRFVGDNLIVTDAGPGLTEDQALAIFSVQRESLSSKRWRRADRGALGNGTRVVVGIAYVSGGLLIVESRGFSLALTVAGDGSTRVIERAESEISQGTRITLRFGGDLALDKPAILRYAADCQRALGRAFGGTRAVPGWFDVPAMRELVRDMPQQTSVMDFVRRFDITPATVAATKSLALRTTTSALLDNSDLLASVINLVLCGQAGERRLKRMGRNACEGTYAFVEGRVALGGARLPCIVEVWVRGRPVKDRKTDGDVTTGILFANRTPALQAAEFGSVAASTKEFKLGLGTYVYTTKVLKGPCNFIIDIAITAPELPVVSDGKAVDLDKFADMIMEALKSALPRAYLPPQQALTRTSSTKPLTIKGAVYAVIKDTYAQIAAAGIGVPPRMLMYRCRPRILEMTGRSSFEYATFINAIHDFMDDEPKATADWQLSYDDRGHFIMPGGATFGLGTQAVNRFIADLHPDVSRFDAVIRGLTVTADAGELSEDRNPARQFGAVCFIEKEGYSEIIRKAGIAERFDVAFASTKGLPNTAIRKLLDTLAAYGVKVFCLHDFDIAGLTIANTLATSNRRYRFENELNFIDMGMRLATAQALGLPSEPFERDSRVSPDKLRERLRGYDATAAEVRMLVDECRRVEIDAMADPSAVVEFIEACFIKHGVGKIVPDDEVMAAHFRSTAFAARLDNAIEPLRAEFTERFNRLARDFRERGEHEIVVPPLRKDVEQHLARNPRQTWRDAVVAVARDYARGRAT